MKKLILLSLFFVGFQSLSAQIYLSNNEWSSIKSLVDQFNINADKFINNEDAFVSKDLKKNIWTLTSKMNYYADRVVKSQTFDEGDFMSDKTANLLYNENVDHRILRLEFNTAEVNTIARAALDLMEMKADLKTRSYTLNMGDPADKTFIKKYREILNKSYLIQNSKFESAYKAAIN